MEQGFVDHPQTVMPSAFGLKAFLWTGPSEATDYFVTWMQKERSKRSYASSGAFAS